MAHAAGSNTVCFSKNISCKVLLWQVVELMTSAHVQHCSCEILLVLSAVILNWKLKFLQFFARVQTLSPVHAMGDSIWNTILLCKLNCNHFQAFNQFFSWNLIGISIVCLYHGNLHFGNSNEVVGRPVVLRLFQLETWHLINRN